MAGIDEWNTDSPVKPGRYWFYGWWGDPTPRLPADLYHVIVREPDRDDRKHFGYVLTAVYECNGVIFPGPFKFGRWKPVGFIDVPSYELALEVVEMAKQRTVNGCN